MTLEDLEKQIERINKMNKHELMLFLKTLELSLLNKHQKNQLLRVAEAQFDNFADVSDAICVNSVIEED